MLNLKMKLLIYLLIEKGNRPITKTEVFYKFNQLRFFVALTTL